MAETAEKIAPSPGRTWWEDEVAALLRARAQLDAAARGAVRCVLVSLAADRDTDAATLRDVRLLLASLEAERPAA